MLILHLDRLQIDVALMSVKSQTKRWFQDETTNTACERPCVSDFRDVDIFIRNKGVKFSPQIYGFHRIFRTSKIMSIMSRTLWNRWARLFDQKQTVCAENERIVFHGTKIQNCKGNGLTGSAGWSILLLLGHRKLCAHWALLLSPFQGYKASFTF